MTFETIKKNKSIKNKIDLSTNNVWNKIKKYYEITDLSSYYVVTIVLNPVYKWRYFDIHWKNNRHWIPKMKKKMKTLWSTYKIQYEKIVEEKQLLSPNSSSIKLSPIKNSFKNFVTCSQTTDIENEVADEYKTYCQLSILKSTSQNLII